MHPWLSCVHWVPSTLLFVAMSPLRDKGSHEEQEAVQRAWQTTIPKLRSKDTHQGSATQHKIPQAH